MSEIGRYINVIVCDETSLLFQSFIVLKIRFVYVIKSKTNKRVSNLTTDNNNNNKIIQKIALKNLNMRQGLLRTYVYIRFIYCSFLFNSLTFC